jgi:hypothetical protein
MDITGSFQSWVSWCVAGLADEIWVGSKGLLTLFINFFCYPKGSSERKVFQGPRGGMDWAWRRTWGGETRNGPGRGSDERASSVPASF